MGIVAGYFVATPLLFHIFGTLTQGPYESLLPKIARDVPERVSLSGFKVYSGIAGAALCLIGSGVLVDQFGFQVMAIVMAILAIVGSPVAGVYLFPSPLIAITTDHDAAITGHLSGATFYGTQTFVEKTVSALAPLLLGSVLLLGNTTSNPTGVRLAGPLAGIVVFRGFQLFRGFERALTSPHSLAPAPASSLQPTMPTVPTSDD